MYNLIYCTRGKQPVNSVMVMFYPAKDICVFLDEVFGI